ncbi:Cas9 inhibitor AcrIIA9 family protein [Chryseobacterium arthrosphaerae]|uniref:Cas9 inhibitor AcrIIA9 family protein n=1 Tax=Chryseobacterium arthrosphaerae TaxID=651561 RepID=A0ABU7R2V2_9FLAO
MKASNEFEKAIKAYLDEASKTNTQLAEALKNEGKTLTSCCMYILEQVKKKNVHVMTNDEVFAIANEYYLSEKELKPKKINCKVVVTGDTGSPKVESATETKPKKKKKEPALADGTQLSIF